MADNVVAENVAQQPQAQQQPRASAFEVVKSLVSRMIMMCFIVQTMNYFRSKPNLNENLNSTDTNAPSGNMFQKGAKFVSQLDEE
jgi:hypothetical protein